MVLLRYLAAGIVWFLAWPAAAFAGMPNPFPLLTEVGRLRLQNLSFFLLGFLLSALAIQIVWNLLHRDVPTLPRLSYPRAVGLVVLWGLLFVLVLTMISGALELMTPGAWEPQGATYRLREPPPQTDTSEEPRREQLLLLKSALWQYAHEHGGRFPPDRADPAIARERWRLPDASRLEYVYRGGVVNLSEGQPLALEPEVYPDGRWVLFTDGKVRRLSQAEIARVLPAEKP